MIRMLFALLMVILALGVGAAVTMSVSRVQEGPSHRIEGVDPAEGRALFDKYGCSGCHVIAGVPLARGKVGPPLSNVGERLYLAGRLPNTPENMVRWIMDPQDIDPGNAMPNLNVTLEDARAMAAYFYRLVR